MKFQMLIKTKIPKKEDFSCYKTLICCIYHANYWARQISCSVQLSMKKKVFLNSRPGFPSLGHMYTIILLNLLHAIANKHEDEGMLALILPSFF